MQARVFPIDTLEYKSNKIVKVLLEKEAHLCDEEIVIEKASKDSLVEFYQLLDELRQDKTSLNVDIHDHFQEIRRNIDLQREELKEKIDKVALTMIDQTKEMEVSYSSLCEKIQYGDACNGLEENLKKFNDLWREMEIDFEKIYYKNK
jgi:hypothetical protein